ncbi:COR domain-containing protein [Haliscomenobacter sp.]|uniref:COR domain-containing protein n=1 Tax=Haliscomenobacter sp. TaxID=2717303 RepID=UPI003593A666
MTANMEEALQRIQENKRTKSKILDLSRLELTELPNELWECVWVEELNFGRSHYWNEEKNAWDYYEDRGICSNRLSSLPLSISNFRHLTLLFLDANPITDLAPLRLLTHLKSLDLSDTSVSDLSSLSALVNLTTLNLIYTQVSDLSALTPLLNLNSLYLRFTKTTDLSPLSSLINLTTLNLSYTHVSDLSPLSSLTNLSHLDLGHSHVSDLSPLSSLLNLNYLDLKFSSVHDLAPLSSLTNLDSLYLSATAVSDLDPLGSLLNLEFLFLGGTSVSNLEPLCHLRNLKWLELSATPVSYFPLELLFLPELEMLELDYTHCLNLPSEFTSLSNALPALLDYFTELKKNAYPSYDAKQIIIGNGRVGKTSLLKALYGLDDFNPAEDSTHGIQLFDTTLTLPEKQATVNLSLWDFGGQELYHATHRIFMQSSALYLVVWDPATESNPGEETVQLHGQDYTFRNYPLSYWLSNVRALSPDSKIIVVCNKCDDGQEHFPLDLQELKAVYRIDSFISISAKTGYGISTLRQRIQYLLDRMPEMGMYMPVSWRNVREKLTDLRGSQPCISLEEFQNVCESETIWEDSMHTLLYFLHQAGFLFWHEKYLKTHIIIDQKWALEAIYQLLDRNGWYPLLKGNALRQRNDLAKCWSAYTPVQIDLFLDLMQTCELALRLEDEESDNPHFLIPEFLPGKPAPAVADIWGADKSPIYHCCFYNPFFYPFIIQRFIVRCAKLAERYDLLWHTGLLLKVDGTMALVRIYPEIGDIQMQLRGANPADLLERIINEIKDLQMTADDEGFFLSVSGDPDEWVPLPELQDEINDDKTHIASTTRKVLEIAPFHILLTPNQQEEENQNALGLKELSDIVSGAQLLEPIEPTSPLEALKNQVKSKLIDGIPAAITLLRQHIATNTSTFDDLILIHGQYQRYHEDLTLYDVLSAEERRIGYNRIQKSILELVNSLEEGDIKD